MREDVQYEVGRTVELGYRKVEWWGYKSGGRVLVEVPRSRENRDDKTFLNETCGGEGRVERNGSSSQ